MDIMDDVNKGGEIAKIIIEFANVIARNPVFWILIITGATILYKILRNK